MIVSFYTPDYAHFVPGMLASLEKFSLPYQVDAVESVGDWYADVYRKPTFIREKLGEHGEVIWLDIDAEILLHPDELIGGWKTHDLTLPVHLPGHHGCGRYSTAVMGLRATLQTFAFLDTWELFLREGEQRYAGDQGWVDAAVAETPGLKVHELPPTYLLFEGRPPPTKKRDIKLMRNPVVKHFQGSRQARLR